MYFRKIIEQDINKDTLLCVKREKKMRYLIIIILLLCLCGCTNNTENELPISTPYVELAEPMETPMPRIATEPIEPEPTASEEVVVPEPPIENTPESVPKQKSTDSNIIAKHTTKILDKDKNRIANIKLAAKSIDGKVIKNGETFSFNKAVGERTEKKGYKVAGILIQEEHSEGIGGGICQVSTTLLGAFKKAEFDVVEHHTHKIKVAYAKRGEDATVNYNNLDLKVKNTTGADIKVKVSASKNYVTVKLVK